MANTTYIDAQGRRKKGYTEDVPGLNIPSESIYAKRLEQLNADTQRQINNLNADYEGMNTQLYRDYMKSKKTLPQQLSAQGISGGLSESTNLGLETLYHDRLLQNEKNRQRGISDIEAKGSSNAMNVLQDYSANAAERANTMASIGDFSGYKELGYTDEQIAALKAAWEAANAPKVRYSGGKREEKPTYGKGYNTLNNSSLGIKASEWDHVYNNIATLLRSGSYTALGNYMDQVSGDMNEDQTIKTDTLLAKYGIVRK
ncbi:MAG: hypothetical protein E7420_00560 [Ruminococcaceae bacterium]|nr:hypothetical protein [Oscillospiraceae bacterium]